MADNIQEKIEDKIIDWVIRGGGDRLTVFKPPESKNGVDLVVKKKGEYESRHGQSLSQNPIVKAQVFGIKKQKSKEEIFLYVRDKNEEIDNLKLGAGKNYYMIIVSFDAVKQDISNNVRIIKLDNKKEFLINRKDLSQTLFHIISPI